MLNTLHQLTKITLTALLLTIITWLAIDVLAIDALAKDASDNNKHHPSRNHVEERAIATPSMESKLNQVGITPLESPPTECSIINTRSPQTGQNRSFNSVEYSLLRALPSVALIPIITRIGAQAFSPNDWAAIPLNRPSASATKGTRRTLGSCIVTTPADSGAGSLRQCLLDITANGTITFDPQTFPPNTPTTISLSSVLPSITTDGLTIDGTTAGVVLDGTGLSAESYGLGLDGTNGVTIKGLQIVNFLSIGIFITNGASNNVIGGNDAQARNIISGNKVGIAIGGSSNNNQIIGNYIGTDVTGTTSWGNEFGITLTNTGGAQNIIGGPESEGNLISGNGVGVQIEYEGASSNQVLGNLIGTDVTGGTALANDYGVIIRLGAQNNTIGGESDGARNIISGNQEVGVLIQEAGTNGNQVLGNFIGTDVTGRTRLDNKLGVAISANPNSQEIGPANNVIGGTSDGARNIISGNTTNGLEIAGPQATNNRIEGNYIGTNINGTESLGNISGVIIHSGAHHNTIGGDQQGAGNLISGNDAGIAIKGSQSVMTTDNLIQGNYIGTDVTGRASLPNKEGITILENTHRNIIGGSTENARNIISGNENSGVWIGQERTAQRRVRDVTENQVLGNYIGIDVTGTVVLSNRRGVVLNESEDNIIGCESLEGCNIISGNRETGIMIQGTASRNQVIGNFIGTNVNGTSALANGVVGIGIIAGAHDNIIGGGASGKRNVISGNTKTGVDIRNADTMNNQVIGNYIGTDKTGTMLLPNNWGVVILEDADYNIVGGPTAEKRNIISGNNDTGVQIQAGWLDILGQFSVLGERADHNQIQGNYIGTDVTGLETLSNQWGIAVIGGKNNLIGGTSTGEGNLISGNQESGIEILSYNLLTFRYEAKDNKVQGNLIGLNADETALGNGFAGICLFNGTTSNTIGPDNTIAYNADAGVRIQDSDTDQNTITENSIHHNSRLPIDLTDSPPSINRPILNNWTDNVVEGSTCQGCTIEIFANPDATPAGTLFLATGTANQEGNFTITLPTVPTELSCLSATATDRTGTTEEFSDSLCTDDSPIATTTPIVSNSPTVTPTAINSPTATPTAINSPTATPTAINSSTATPTAINSSTATPTAINSFTATPTTSNSPTATPTAINSFTATPTTSNSPTATPTAINSSTATPTAINSSTATPTAINSSTATPTVSNSPTATTQSNQIYLPLVIR